MPDTYPNNVNVIKNTTENYDKLIRERDIYVSFVKSEMDKREIIKGDKFKTKLLNIKISKFKGYNSELDIYSFQSIFEKLYSKCTPADVLPDLLKHNYLEEPALSLVRRLDTIDDIWGRLKRAYGDAKILLKNKVAELRKVGQLWKSKDAE